MSDLPDVKLKALPTFPAVVTAEPPILLAQSVGGYNFSLDEDQLRRDIGAPSIDDITNGSAAAQASADQAQDYATTAQGFAADAAASAASLSLPTIVADSFLVGNGGGTAWITKTPAQARSLLETPSFNDLPYVIGGENGVPGDGSDQTTALQAIVDGLPAEGGNILLAGTVSITGLDLHGKRNIRFIGLGGNGAGASQRTMITTGAGSGIARIIDCRDTTNVSFERSYLNSTNSAFDGTLLDYGVISTGSYDMSFDECFMNVSGASASGLDLYGAVTGRWSRSTFSGAGRLISLQNVSGLSFCNEHAFETCNFLPTNQYPIVGSGDAVSFRGCNWQAGSSDGKGRAFLSSSNVKTRGISFFGCGFYDVVSSGTSWVALAWGGGLDVRGCYMGGVSGTFGFDVGGVAVADPEDSGWGGVAIFGNHFDTLSNVLSLEGSNSDGSNVRGVVAGGNRLINTPSMYGNVSSASGVVNLPNRVYSHSGGVDETLTVYGIPTSASGLNTGQIWSNSGVLTIVG